MSSPTSELQTSAAAAAVAGSRDRLLEERIAGRRESCPIVRRAGLGSEACSNR